MEIHQHACDIDHRDADKDVVLFGEREAGVDHLAGGGGAHLLAVDGNRLSRSFDSDGAGAERGGGEQDFAQGRVLLEFGRAVSGA